MAFFVARGIINGILSYLINAIGLQVFILFALINLVRLMPISVYIGMSTLHKVAGLLIKTTETANTHVEDLDLLFAEKSSIYWRAEKGSSC